MTRCARDRARPILALLFALLATGCAALSRPPPSEPGFDRLAFTLANGFLHVEVRIPQAPPGPKPAVIGPLGLAEELLDLGVIVVGYQADWSVVERFAGDAEAPAAPRRVGSWLLAAPRPGIVGKGYFGVIDATARSMTSVVDLLVDLPDVDPGRIGIAGSSTHGFVALEALRREPRLAAGVVRVACGDYHRFLRSSSLALNDEARWLPRGRLVLDADYEATLREREPIRHAAAYPPRALLLLNGARDPAIPRACAESTSAAFERAYRAAGAPERFAFVLYAEAGHDLGLAAEERILAWWREWLLPPEPGDEARWPVLSR